MKSPNQALEPTLYPVFTGRVGAHSSASRFICSIPRGSAFRWNSGMTPRKRILFWVVLLSATSLLVLVCVTRKSQTIDVSVSYLGTENYKHWGLCSYFGVTNKSCFSVKRWPPIQVEDQKTGTWVTVMYQENKFLGPGEGETVVFQRPTNQGPWRLVFTLSRTSLRSRSADFVAGYSWSKYIPLRLRGVPCDFRKSDWVKGE